MYDNKSTSQKICWNKGKLVGQKRPLKLEEIWSIRIWLELANNLRELTMFNLALDCKLRAYDFIKLNEVDAKQHHQQQLRHVAPQGLF